MNNQLIKVSLVLILNSLILASFADRQVYIVYLGESEHNENRTLQQIEDHHHSYLHSVKGSLEEAKSSIIYSYTKVFNGFSAILTPAEADALSTMDGVISVWESKSNQLQTSRSWDFISSYEADGNPAQAGGLDELLRKANNGMNVVVGVLDSGIWPESQSFADAGMDPIPTSWKGTCQAGVQFDRANCNKKLIGARYYVGGYEAKYGPVNPAVEYRSARDRDGHGTHVASTAGGRRVASAAAFGGFGKGTVRGGAPDVRLAIYKVCWVMPNGGTTCEDSDVFAAFDDVINDGVDVINLSHGTSHRPYNQDANAVGALLAAKWDIVAVCAAGNSGPTSGTVANVAPWTITVAASSIDRVFSAVLQLGNGYEAQGQSITPLSRATTLQLVYAGKIENQGTTTAQTSGQCRPGTLSPALARGKAVLCLKGHPPYAQALEVQRATGAAALLQNQHDGIGVSLQRFPIPTIVVLASDISTVRRYITIAANPFVILNPTTTLQPTRPPPFMAEFSSKGPNMVQPNLLKPDVTAPGLNILAASTEASSPDDKFTFMSGTSMASPHVAAVAALLKAVHPIWSNAAIISAIMTTAKVTNTQGNPITDASQNAATPFEYGSGHIQPSKAADPGLVYEASYADYIGFACASTGQSLDPQYKCPSPVPSPSNLNYPSLTIANVGSQGTTVTRRVKNVGGGSPRYTVTISQPPGYTVQISPTVMNFSPAVETQSFTVTVRALNTAVRNQYAFGSYTWSDGQGRQVRSPIVVSTTGNSIITAADADLHAST